MLYFIYKYDFVVPFNLRHCVFYVIKYHIRICSGLPGVFIIHHQCCWCLVSSFFFYINTQFIFPSFASHDFVRMAAGLQRSDACAVANIRGSDKDERQFPRWRRREEGRR